MPLTIKTVRATETATSAKVKAPTFLALLCNDSFIFPKPYCELAGALPCSVLRQSATSTFAFTKLIELQTNLFSPQMGKIDADVWKKTWLEPAPPRGAFVADNSIPGVTATARPRNDATVSHLSAIPSISPRSGRRSGWPLGKVPWKIGGR